VLRLPGPPGAKAESTFGYQLANEGREIGAPIALEYGILDELDEIPHESGAPSRGVAGLCLLDRGILTMARAGIERIVVLVPQGTPVRLNRGWMFPGHLSQGSFRPACAPQPTRVSRPV
jgi:hypothetical protein